MSNESATKPVIWVVEDDPYTLMICLRLLGKNGYEYRGFSSAEELLDAAWQPDVSIVLSDIHLPGISGCELCRRLKQENLPDLTIIALDTSLERKSLLDCGFDEVLTKPFTEQSLLNVLGTATGASGLAFPLLEQLIEDPQDRKEILARFGKDTTEDLLMLEEAIARKDTEKAAQLTHRLAGRFAQMDQRELADVLLGLESRLWENTPVDELLPELGTVMENIRKFQGKLEMIIA